MGTQCLSNVEIVLLSVMLVLIVVGVYADALRIVQ